MTAQSFGGAITGTGGLTKLGAGALTLTGASTYSGATIIGGGKLALDFSPAGGPASDIISSSSPLTLSGGTIEVIGAAGDNNNQSFNGLTVTAGGNTIRAISGAGGTVNLTLGAITRHGGLANFVLRDSGPIRTSTHNGLPAGRAPTKGSHNDKGL